MGSDGSFGLKGAAFVFAALVIGLAGTQAAPGGQFDLLTKVVRRPVSKPVKVADATQTTFTSTTAVPTSSNSLYTELTAIPSSFDITPLLTPTWGEGRMASTSAPDPVGAFRFVCGPGQVKRADPIVYPGQANAGHLHQFFGNLGADENSTYDSLRKTGGSSCEGNPATPGMALNRSAYWMPAMLDGKGNVVRPDYVSVYYKRRPISDPMCHRDPADPTASEGDCVPLPNGLRFIFGYDMLTGKAPTGETEFHCEGQTAAQGTHRTITAALVGCPTAKNPDGSFNRLIAVISAPSCWDGKNLDSPNHRDHVAYRVFDGQTGRIFCPLTHPKMIPDFRMAVGFTLDANINSWHLSSDEMLPNAVPGTTFHADWFGAWDNQVEAMWMDNCINRQLSCSGGDLGNGKQIWGMWGTSWFASPRLVPVPA